MVGASSKRRWRASLAGTGNINADPLFVRSPWTGPDGLFGTADDDLGNLRLRGGSLALDIGSNAAIPAGVGIDMAGQTRIQNGIVDLGAYEGPASATAPKVLYVDASATGTGTGGSWANAFTSLPPALLAAVDGDTIRIADGTYRPTATADRTVTFALRNSVAIYGSYAGYGAANPDVRNTTLYPTVLSGDISKVGENADNSYHVMIARGVGGGSVLDGLTITGGNANGSDWNGHGGGLYNYSTPTLTNCTFVANSADRGGGMYTTASLTLTRITFLRNTASNGGGLFTLFSAATLTNCTFVANTASYGGGISNGVSSPTLVNCTFIGNSANSGGAMYNQSAWPFVTNCTFTANTASSSGGGIYNTSSWTLLYNTIVWGNGSSPISDVSSTPYVMDSDVEGGYTGTGNINADPQFLRNPSPGTDSTWGTSDDDYGNLRLRSTSPCIDAGYNSAPGLSIVTTDSAGSPRIDGSAVDMGAYELDRTAPTIAAVSINDGAIQRSMVKKLAVSFSEPVALASDALTVKLSIGATIPNTTVTVTNPSADQKSYVLSFSGSAAIGGSLADGIYDLLITASAIQDLAGNVMTANFSQRFHRLFGDSDGNKIVNALDYARLKQSFGRAPSDPLFNSAFDYEGNGLINALDLARFRQRYGLSFSY